MEYKDFFERAVNASERRFPAPDAGRTVSGVISRACAEKDPRAHRVLRAAAGIAAALVVIGGSVWGIGYLNEHGGLREGGIKTGTAAAGPENTEIPAQSELSAAGNAVIGSEDVRYPKDIMDAEGDVLEFSDMTAVIREVGYDGQFLRVILSSEYHGEVYPSDTDRAVVFLKPTDGFEYTGTYSMDERSAADPDNEGRRLHTNCFSAVLPAGRKIGLTFSYRSPASGSEMEQISDYTLTGVDMSGVNYKAEDAAKGISVTVSEFGAVIESPQDYANDDHFSAAVRYNDGTVTVLADRGTTVGETAWDPDRAYGEFPEYYTELGYGKTTLVSCRDDRIDVENIAAVLINGEEIGTAVRTDPNGEQSPEYPEPSRRGYYEGEAALEILRMYAGEDFCYPLEVQNTDKLTYRTHDEWLGNERSGDYRFSIAAENGEPIFAVTGGTVVEVNVEWLPIDGQPKVDDGIYVVIQAPDGRKWQYSHLYDHYVNVGDTVSAGDMIAAAGATGWCTGPLVCISFPDSIVIDPAKQTSVIVGFTGPEISGMYDFLYYIDGELQKDMTETRELYGTDEFRWDVTGSGAHTYRILVRCAENRLYETLAETTVDFDGELPAEGFRSTFDRQILKELSEHPQGDLSLIEGIYAPGENPYEVIGGEEPETAPEEKTTLPEFPIAISNGGGLYGEYLDPPITGDDAWKLVKERGGIDYDYPLPYVRDLFTFTGTAFVIDHADCDVTAFAGGTVEFAGFYMGWGQMVLIHDENGHYWLYGHLGEIDVTQGDRVESGEKIGHTGSSGYTTHQLFAMRVG